MMTQSPIEMIRDRLARLVFLVVGLVVGLSQPNVLNACGPFFPNWLLLNPDHALAVAPETIFSLEVQRLQAAEPKYHAQPGQTAGDSVEAEMRDLKTALRLLAFTDPQIESILSRHARERSKIAGLKYNQIHSDRDNQWEGGWDQLWPGAKEKPRLSAQLPQVIPGLPLEFAEYFRGAVAWHQGNQKAARLSWTKLLELPVQDRHFKSTWAAYMLGRSWEVDNRRQAIKSFRQVRALADQGLGDTLGLAVASLGYEARLHLRNRDYREALALYLKQAAAGDSSATASLSFSIRLAFEAGGKHLRKLAAHPACGRLVTAWLASRLGWQMIHTDGVVKETILGWMEKASTRFKTIPNPQMRGWHSYIRPLTLWLEAIEAEDIREAELAELLALAAYQAGDIPATQRWLKRAETTPVTEWLSAKLLLRAGKVEAAAQVLAKTIGYFPLSIATSNEVRQVGLEARLTMPNWYSLPGDAGNYIRGEMGVLQLARGHYLEALDILLRSGFWGDAAYVAERVLTLEELLNYVNLHWSPNQEKSIELADLPEINETADPRRPIRLANLALPARLRYLLARRLARAQQYGAAAPYYPAEIRPYFLARSGALARAQSEENSRDLRAKNLWLAARLTRYQGMELLGTELGPDWTMHAGNYTDGPSLEGRLSNASVVNLKPTPAEQTRASRHVPQPNERFHYRYLAADLAWEAAELMPGNSRETALVLHEAGGWLKTRDPLAADRFYKALVNRCGTTDIGLEADRLHWFPELDERGEIKPREAAPNAE